MPNTRKITLDDLIPANFDDAFLDIMDHGHTHYVFKGGRGSCKSSAIGFAIILLLTKPENRNLHAIVFRKTANTLRDSVYAQIQFAIEQLGMTDEFKFTGNPMKITYLRTKQTIIFRGVDDKLKLKSLKAPFGYFGITWLEEADTFSGMSEIRNILQSTMRGGSDLTRDEDSSDKGLDLEYATAWSYGWEELPNLMIPDFNGGSSAGAVDPDKSETIRLLRQAGQSNIREVAKALPLYWGPQPFTAGPMYMGAITIFLFILALGLYRGKEKWWMLIPTLIGIGLALGNHFMGFTKFWYYHVPFYNKFRTVSMALVILQYTLPMLGFLVLDRIVKAGYDRKSFLRAGLVALGVTGGFCLLCWLMPSLFGTFTSAADADMQEQIVQTLILDRIHLFRQDALVSLLLILATFALLWWAYLPKEETVAARRRVYAAAAVCALVLINMTAVGKRYLNADHFVSQRQFDNQFTERPVDQAILADPDPSYRVLDLTVNVFNDSHPSYFHKNIGGYSPVKLQRYQDLIERYLTPEINSIYRALQGATTVAEAEAALPALPVLSLLNDRYIILDENAAPLTNRNAMGNAWFVSKTVRASTADEEIALLGSADLRTEAVLGPDFADVQIPAAADSLDSIVLTEYAPNELRYHYRLSAPRAAVFSEIWYPSGWTAQADGEAVDLFRTDWTLRGAVLPAGEHDLVLRFDPPSYRISSNISRASSLSLILLTLLALACVLVPGLRRKENE